MTIETIVARYGLAAVFVGAGIEGETAVVTGGVLAHQGLIPLWATMLAAVGGSFAADQIFFAGGRHFRDSRIVRRFREKPGFDRALHLLETWPRAFIFVYRFIYGIRTASPIAIGTSRVPTATFVAVNLLAATVWGCLFSAIGYLFGQGLERWFGRIGLRHVLLLVLAAALVAGVALLLWRRRRDRRKVAA